MLLRLAMGVAILCVTFSNTEVASESILPTTELKDVPAWSGRRVADTRPRVDAGEFGMQKSPGTRV